MATIKVIAAAAIKNIKTYLIIGKDFETHSGANAKNFIYSP